MTPKYIAYLQYQKEYRERMRYERDRAEMFKKSKRKDLRRFVKL